MLSIKKDKELLLNIILNCDPILLDTACQIRASRLLNYYDLIHATPEQPVSTADEQRCIQYVLMCQMLTDYGHPKLRPTLDLYQLDPAIRPEIPNSGYKLNLLNLKLDKRSIKTGALYLFIEDEHLHYAVRPGESSVEATARFSMDELKTIGIESLPPKLTSKIIETHLTPKLVDILKITTERGHTPISLASKENFIAKAVEKIAKESIDFLKVNAPSLDGIAKYFEDDYLYMTKGKNKHATQIKLLPCFISTHLMLQVLKTNHALLIINLERTGCTDETTRIYYRYHNQHGRFQALDTKHVSRDEGALEIDMHSCISDRNDTYIEAFFSDPNFISFVREFKAFDIEKIILMGAAAHPQYPADAKGKLEDIAMDFPREDVVHTTGSSGGLSELDVALEHISSAQYSALYAAAHYYNLLNDDMPSPAKIKHIHVSKKHEYVNNRVALESLSFFEAVQPAATALEEVTNQPS